VCPICYDLLLFVTIRHYSAVFATIRHYSRLVALFATIRYALFGFSRHPAQNATNFNKQIIEFRSQLFNVCPSVLLRSIHAKIQALNSKLFHHLEQTKKHKLENLTNPLKHRTAPLENQKHHTVLTIPEDLPVSNTEKSILIAKASNSSKKTDEFTTRQDVEKFIRRVQLKAFFHDKEEQSDTTEEDLLKHQSRENQNGLHQRANSHQ